MRKILLASTALVALTSVSAMAADVTISGSASLIYKNDDKQEATTGGDCISQLNVFRNRHETLASQTPLIAASQPLLTLDLTKVATLTTQQQLFPAILVQSKSFRRAPTQTTLLATMKKQTKLVKVQRVQHSDLVAQLENQLVTSSLHSVDGLTLQFKHSNEDFAESFGYGASFNAGIATIGYGKMATNTTDYTSVNVSGTLAGVAFGLEQNKVEAGTSKDEATLMGVSYTMDATTLAYETGSAKNESGDLDDYKQIRISYAVAPGITTVITSSEVTGSIQQTAQPTFGVLKR